MISILTICILPLCGPSYAESTTKNASRPAVIDELPKFSDSPEGIGLGFAVGEPTGIAGAYRPHEKHTIAGVVGWGLRRGTIHLHADYLATVARIQPPESILTADIYTGAGPTINIGDSSQPGFGVRVPVGVSLTFQKPIDIYMEVAPVIGFLPSTDLWANGTAGVRTWFRPSNRDG